MEKKNYNVINLIPYKENCIYNIGHLPISFRQITDILTVEIIILGEGV